MALIFLVCIFRKCWNFEDFNLWLSYIYYILTIEFPNNDKSNFLYSSQWDLIILFISGLLYFILVAKIVISRNNI